MNVNARSLMDAGYPILRTTATERKKDMPEKLTEKHKYSHRVLDVCSVWERFLLFLVKEKRYIDREEIPNTVIVYKKMRCRIYILDIYSIPPEHINCRCAVIGTPNNGYSIRSKQRVS